MICPYCEKDELFDIDFDFTKVGYLSATFKCNNCSGTVTIEYKEVSRG